MSADVGVGWIYEPGESKAAGPGETAKTEPAAKSEHPLMGWVTVSGEVYIERSGKRILVTKDGTPVLAGDRIITGNDGLAKIDLPGDNPALRWAEPSRVLQLGQFSESDASILLIGENGEVEMHAPQYALSQ